MATSPPDKALQYVGQILETYNAAEKAGATALGYALECGKHLCSAFNTVEAAKGISWKKWREKNLKDVSGETEEIYRRLARAVGKRDDVFANCKSIRAALKHLSKLDDDLNPKPQTPKQKRTTKSGSGSTATRQQQSATDTSSTGGLKAELENAGADEIIVNLEADNDKLEEVAKASIAKFTPNKVCSALIEVWDKANIVELCNQLRDHGIIFTPRAAQPDKSKTNYAMLPTN